jgi:hypothetical protein
VKSRGGYSIETPSFVGKRLVGDGGPILGPTNRYSNKKKGMWPSCVERCTPKPVSQ